MLTRTNASSTDCLASPHFGERMALDWLDAARYADTNGYSIDGGRHLWLWRDWVIDAFNRNLPYDQFLVEQLAGDLLAGPHRGPTHRHRLSAQQHGHARRWHDPRGKPRQLQRRSREDTGRGRLGADARLRSMPRSQVRPAHAARLLPDVRVLQYAERPTASTAIAARIAIPVLEAKTVLPATDVPELREKIASLRHQLAHPNAAEVATWEVEQQRELALRGKDLELHSMKCSRLVRRMPVLASTSMMARFIRVTNPGELLAYDISMRFAAVRSSRSRDYGLCFIRLRIHPPAAGGTANFSDATRRREGHLRAHVVFRQCRSRAGRPDQSQSARDHESRRRPIVGIQSSDRKVCSTHATKMAGRQIDRTTAPSHITVYVRQANRREADTIRLGASEFWSRSDDGGGPL